MIRDLLRPHRSFPTSTHICSSGWSDWVSCIPINAPNAAAQGSRPKFPLPSTLPAVVQEEIISYWTSETVP